MISPIIMTLIEQGGYAKGPGESVPHAELRCALERLEALEASRKAGNYLHVEADLDVEGEAVAALMSADGEQLAVLGGIDAEPPHPYFTVVEADLAMDAGYGSGTLWKVAT